MQLGDRAPVFSATVNTSNSSREVSMRLREFSTALIVSIMFCVPGLGQANGRIRGVVTLETSGNPVHSVAVTIIQLKRTAETDDNGIYEFQDVPPGNYDVVAHLDRVPDVVHSVQVSSGR